MNHVFYFIKRIYSYSGKILYLNLFGMGLASFLEGIGILLLVPMISYSGIINVDFGGFKFLEFLNFLQDFPKLQALVFILGFFISLVICQNLIQRNLAIRNVKITQGFIRQLRLETYSLLLKTNWEFYTKERKADLINVMTMELARVSGGIIQFLLLLTSLVFTSIQIVIALWLSIKLTMLVLLSGFILALFSRKFIKQSKLLGSKTSILAQEYLAGITDQLNGIKDIKSNTLEESRLHWLNSLTKGMIEEQIEYIKLKTSSQTFYKISSASLIAVFIFIYVMIIDIKPEQFLLILIIFSRLWPRITEIQSSTEQIATTIPAFKALRELQKKCKQAAEINDESIYKNIQPLIIEKGLECRGVFFRYNRNGKYALQNINLNIPINSMTAIVGPSGAGKSTLIDILMGLNKPEQGNVLIDGNLLTEQKLLSLRRSISYVPQDPFLFNTSIRDNLLMIKADTSEEQIWEALKFSAAAEFVKKLPNGLDTIVGDRGIRLSGGERQRLVLARAIIRKPSILVLDEATSALDSENEAKIQGAIEKLKGTMTVVVIAHRLSTIRNADQVIVLEQGEIIQQGQFSQLASEKKGMFSSLLEKQMGVSV
ncbi:ABC transporter ATP-binding protein [Bacillus sp. ISL-40]|uniref:ABC transporter ATP-binding protein n=1 Tax=unclassified Bacillus (in: firmicutes) TaxID=185979 RepID=UPI001BE64752|nr:MULTISPECIES: ABC transporter ATP-binding protein [unclassified Bacillus (in: firmicutes)]MBT2699469.1 ABC transporter ATP-binding protein [Bacillus sp. ISL-40]MBT2722000.1 ABC transporter ATP-binding protein [Bacillus sp. ISL-46]MBT2741652.1 ABC transporter ATP-binding protein [Bacillus sp. ISL-77]